MFAGRVARMPVRLLARAWRCDGLRLGGLVTRRRDGRRIVRGLLGGASTPLCLLGGEPGALRLGVPLGLRALC